MEAAMEGLEVVMKAPQTAVGDRLDLLATAIGRI